MGPNLGRNYRGEGPDCLYGLKSAGAAFRNHLAMYMQDLGYVSCLADPDIWMKAKIREDKVVFFKLALF